VRRGRECRAVGWCASHCHSALASFTATTTTSPTHYLSIYLSLSIVLESTDRITLILILSRSDLSANHPFIHSNITTPIHPLSQSIRSRLLDCHYDMSGIRLLDTDSQPSRADTNTADFSPPYIGVGFSSDPEPATTASSSSSTTTAASSYQPKRISNPNFNAASNSNVYLFDQPSSDEEVGRSGKRSRSSSLIRQQQQQQQQQQQLQYQQHRSKRTQEPRSMCSCFCDLFVSETKENIGSRARDHLANEARTFFTDTFTTSDWER